MKRKIYYVGCYDDYMNNRNLNTQPSGITKMHYIKEALKNAGFYVSIFSIAECKSNKIKFNNRQKILIDDSEDIDYIYSIGRKNLILKLISRIILLIQLLKFIIWERSKNDIILVYHSLAISKIIYFIQIICKRKIYFEVEEIYQAVYHGSNKKVKKEINYLTRSNGYIFVNDVIREKCNLKGKYAVCYGNYLMQQNNSSKKNNDGKIHIVYAGVIEHEGTDAYLAINVAKYLSSKYHIHILGYGLENNIRKMVNYLENIQTKCIVTYDGCLTGDEYLHFLSKCHIGLCTRVLENDLSDYAFPSKLLVYLSNNLRTVCTPIKVIQKSKISSHLFFSANNNPDSIANVILSFDLNYKFDNSTLIKELHSDFILQLQSLFCTNHE